MTSELTILELYPEHLAINGDMGNVRVIRKRLELAGFTVRHVVHNPGETLPTTVDIVTIGSGPASALLALATDIENIASSLRELVETGVPLLAVGGGFHLLGNEIRLPGGLIKGAGVFDLTTDATAVRVVTNCYAVDTRLGRLVGIENHGAMVKLGQAQEPFGSTVTGRGNDGLGNEGAWTGSAIGTHLHGPVLAMNPVVADHIIRAATVRRGFDYQTGEDHARIDVIAHSTRALLAADAHIDVESTGR